MNEERSNKTSLENISKQAHQSELNIQDLNIHDHSIHVTLITNPVETIPKQIGRLSRVMHNNAGTSIEEFVIKPVENGIAGPVFSISRKSLEQALTDHKGSSEEIWFNSVIDDTLNHRSEKAVSDPRENNFILAQLKKRSFKLDLQTQLSPGTGSRDILYRSNAVLSYTDTAFKNQQTFKPFLFIGKPITLNNFAVHRFLGLRINIDGTLDRLRSDIRPPNPNSVRGDIDLFDESQTATLDHSGISLGFKNKNVNYLFHAGYLDEQFFGGGVDVLYQPYKENYGFGVDSFYVAKRDPLTFLATGLDAHNLWSAHIKGSYQLPRYNIDMELRAGRYLGRDWGATITLGKEFNNGIRLEGFGTLTNRSDFDNTGDKNPFEAGLQLSVPIGQILNPVRAQAHITTKYRQFGRDTGQFITPQINLKHINSRFNKSHIENNWHEITE